MTDLKILAPLSIKYFGDLHPFRKWSRNLRNEGINTEIYYDHTAKNLQNAENLMIHHRYFDKQWIKSDEAVSDLKIDFKNYLIDMKSKVGKLIWFDADDSSGSTQFPVMPYVDVFVKKQVLKDTGYYVGNPEERKNLMVWSDPNATQKKFSPCTSDQVHKIKVGYNVAYIDYRNFVVHYRLRKLLSHFLGYKSFPLTYKSVDSDRPFDLTFRGTVNYASKSATFQRNKVLEMFKTSPYKLATGGNVNRSQYLEELGTSKVSISPFGLGEVCFRDFESFMSGALLVKPSMDHLHTFPDLFIPNETYVPVSWDLNDLEATLDKVISNYSSFKEIARNGQQLYKNTLESPEIFINAIKRILN